MTPGRSRFVALLSLMMAGLIWVAATASTTFAALGRASASAPVILVAGDQLVVTGSRLSCAVSAASGAANPITIICGEGSTSGPSPGTYAFALADVAALVLKASASGRPALLVRKEQPAVTGGLFRLPKRAASQSIRIGIGGVFIVGGTDVLCAVTKQSGAPAITCGLAAPAGTFVVGSYAAVLSNRLVVLSRLLPHGKLKTITVQAQPGG